MGLRNFLGRRRSPAAAESPTVVGASVSNVEVSQRAAQIARPVLVSLCAEIDREVPELHIVQSLPGGSVNTARVSNLRGNGTIEIPASLVVGLSGPALKYLLGHELGHIALKRSPAVVLRRTVWAFFWVFGFIPLACVAMGVNGGGPEFFLIAVGSVLMTLPVIATIMALLRRNEADCDLFSVRLQGNISGALEHLGHHAAVAETKKAKGPWERMFDHHPSDVRRMELLRRHFPA